MEAHMHASTAVNAADAGKQRKRRLAWLPWLLLSPTLLLLSVVISGPLIGTLFLSLSDWNGINKPEFIGFANFAELLQDKIFYAALWNNVKWMLFFLTIPVIMGLSAAMFVSKVTRGQMLYRTLLFLPYIVSTVVTAKIWQGIYSPYFGINTVFEKWGWDFLKVSWLGDTRVALFSVAVADTWHFWGFLVVLFLVALHQLDRTLEEAATVDGASRARIVWHIVLPQLRPTLVLVYMLLVIWSFAAFDYVFVMTQGGPGNASELIATYMYKLALYSQEPGYASAIALTMGLFSLIVILGFGLVKKKGWDV
ncbi:MAG TPA: sugar ABC transporter permease [Paenibacillus sp.]|uniref:carbohydrate ABC transporter permease n=1 Tax=Paenibacillus sp. TaxID=58172 RepID=UPI0028D19592|nr:sugar ABC transporter permease [Paenibacillus sp.]HUC91905.1 sugar ABC transporter permease [Paenibacillus sp.]